MKRNQAVGKTLRAAAPFVFLLAGALFFLRVGLIVIPSNDSLAERVEAEIARLDDSLKDGTLPSTAAVEALGKERVRLAEALKALGATAPSSPEESLASVIEEWGYRPGDPMAAGLKKLAAGLAAKLGPANRAMVALLVNNLARRAGEADLFSILSFRFDTILSPSEEAPPCGGPALRIHFSFISGVDEAVRFVEALAFKPPSGLFLKPEKIIFARIDPDIWGASLKHFTGPPVRVDLAYVATAVE